MQKKASKFEQQKCIRIVDIKTCNMMNDDEILVLYIDVTYTESIVIQRIRSVQLYQDERPLANFLSNQLPQFPIKHMPENDTFLRSN